LVVADGNIQSNFYPQEIKAGSSRNYPYTGVPGVDEIKAVSIIPTLGKGINRPCSGQRKELEF